MQVWLGLLLTIAAGVLAGTIVWPAKLMRQLKYEHWGLISSLLGLLILPWVAALLLCPDAIGGYASLPGEVWVKALLFSTAWGVANILVTFCWMRIGVALAVGLLTGIGLPIGVLVPMLFKGSGLFQDAPDLNSPAGCIILVAVAIMLAGVLVKTLAGHGREQVIARPGGFTAGLVMACVAGVLQVGLAFSFVYTQGPIMAAMKQRGASALGANMATWSVCLLGGGLLNVLFPALLMVRNRSWRVLFASGRELGLAVIIAITFTAFVVLMGAGNLLLGALGASVGFGVYQTVQLGGAVGLGFASGEWRGVHGRPRQQMYAAVALLVVAVIIMVCARSIAG